MSEFLRKDEEYKREIDPVGGYMEQTDFYLSTMTGLSLEKVKEWRKKQFAKGGRFEMNAPVATINIRDPETGDRREMTVKVDKLLAAARSKNLVSAPSLVFYLPAKFKRSVLSTFIDANITKRGLVKKEMFDAAANNDAIKAAFKGNEQSSFKTLNNAMSGAHSSKHTILHNKSSHSAFTSTCRSATSYGNANNEKLTAGSRHYWMPGLVVNNILSIATLTDFDEFEDCMSYYDLHYPTVEETMKCIRRSTDPLWINVHAMEHIEELVSKITPLHRAAFVYIGDLYHLRMYNRDIVRAWIGDMITRVDTPIPMDELEVVDKKTSNDLRALVALLRADIVGSRNLGKVKEQNMDEYRILMNTSKHIQGINAKYSKLIRAIMNTRNVPLSVAKMPEAIRRVSLVSDTDSTMATLQTWSEWYCGDMAGEVADNVADAMIYIATQNIGHMMASMSSQMGVEDTYLHRYTMKNEFKFSSFALTSKAKHYFSTITSQEGKLYEEPELEVKGVALRTSNIPDSIMHKFRDTIYNISLEVARGGLIEVTKILDQVADIEFGIVESIKRGESEFLKTGQVKEKEAYTVPSSSNYVYWEWWESTFGPKYGSAGDPPYGIVKLSVNLGNKTSITNWLASMEDRELAGRLEDWHKRNPNRKFSQLLVPANIIANIGTPKELIDVIDFRRIIFSSVEPYYHVLECFKIMLIDKTRSRMVSDFHGTVLDIPSADVTAVPWSE